MWWLKLPSESCLRSEILCYYYIQNLVDLALVVAEIYHFPFHVTFFSERSSTYKGDITKEYKFPSPEFRPENTYYFKYTSGSQDFNRQQYKC